jgi:hypothetical protein
MEEDVYIYIYIYIYTWKLHDHGNIVDCCLCLSSSSSLLFGQDDAAQQFYYAWMRPILPLHVCVKVGVVARSACVPVERPPLDPVGLVVFFDLLAHDDAQKLV